MGFMIVRDFMTGFVVSSARADLRNARELLAAHPLEDWLRPENIEAYRCLMEQCDTRSRGGLSTLWIRRNHPSGVSALSSTPFPGETLKIFNASD